MENSTNCLYYEQLDNFHQWQKQFYENSFSELLDKAAEEWNIISSPNINDNDKFNCELCGQPIIYPARIENIFNGKILIIGSTCVTNYKNITDPNGKTFEELAKEKSEMKIKHANEIKLEKLSPNIISDFSKIKNFQRENSNYLTFDLTIELNDFLNEDISKYEMYIKKKNIKLKELDELTVIHNKTKKLLKKLNNYITFCQTDILGLNTSICEWCKKFATKEAIQQLREDGKITEKTIGEIKEEKFIKKVIPKYEGLLSLNKLNFLDKNQIGNNFKIQLNDIRRIIININSSKFIKKYSEYFFKNKEYIINYNDILDISSITDEKSLYNALIYIFENTRLNSEFDILFYDSEINELAIQQNKKQIYVVNYKLFVQHFKYLIFKENIIKEDIVAIKSHIMKASRQYNYNDYREYLKQYNLYL